MQIVEAGSGCPHGDSVEKFFLDSQRVTAMFDLKASTIRHLQFGRFGGNSCMGDLRFDVRAFYRHADFKS